MTLTSCSNPNESLELRAPMTKQLGILVSSYDAYSDLWPPFFVAFHRSWPDCPFQMYLLSNRITFPDPTVKPILVGDVTAWPESIRLALEQISEDFVLLFLEDWFLQKQVDTGRILRLVEWVTTQRPACIRLQPAAGMVPSEFKGICHLPPGIPYRSSTVLSLWRKDVLLALLRPDETIWQFEIQGSVRTDKYPDFYATEETYLHCLHGVIRGKWIARVRKTLIASGLPVQTQSRSLFSFSDHIAQLGRFMRSRALKLIPIQYQRRIRLWFVSSSRTSAVAGKK